MNSHERARQTVRIRVRRTRHGLLCATVGKTGTEHHERLESLAADIRALLPEDKPIRIFAGDHAEELEALVSQP